MGAPAFEDASQLVSCATRYLSGRGVPQKTIQSVV